MFNSRNLWKSYQIASTNWFPFHSWFHFLVFLGCSHKFSTFFCSSFRACQICSNLSYISRGPVHEEFLLSRFMFTILYAGSAAKYLHHACSVTTYIPHNVFWSRLETESWLGVLFQEQKKVKMFTSHWQLWSWLYMSRQIY